MLSPQLLQQIQGKFQEMLDADEGEKIKKIIAIDGKTMCGNQQNGEKPSHIVSAWSAEDGFCLGQTAVDEKSNEITAIPELLDKINIENQVITIDAMGTQTEIAETIRKKRAAYVLALKKNQGTLYQDVLDYFSDKQFLEDTKANGGYKRSEEKAHGNHEVREYYQTEDIRWLPQRSKWKDLKSIGMEQKTITHKDGKVSTEFRLYISSLPKDIELFSRAVRRHWSVEVMHWHLDVTFREDANRTIEKNSAQNLNIIRKFCLSVLKLVEIFSPKLSLKKKRFAITQQVERYLEVILNF